MICDLCIICPDSLRDSGFRLIFVVKMNMNKIWRLAAGGNQQVWLPVHGPLGGDTGF